MPVIVRNYRKYKDWKMPIITLGLKYNENWYPVDAYVDSGAIYSIFRQTVGERMDIEIDKGKLIYSQVGDSGSIPVYLHEIEMQLGPRIFKATIGFSEKLGIGFNILGRSDVFDKFIICFDDMKNYVTFTYFDTPNLINLKSKTPIISNAPNRVDTPGNPE